jgi:hypothetical protein
MRPRRRYSEQEQRRLTITAGNLASLKNHPAWPDLRAAIADKQERLRKTIMAEALNRSKPINQREIDYRQGFIQGMEYMVAVCEGAESRLEQLFEQTAEGSGT